MSSCITPGDGRYEEFKQFPPDYTYPGCSLHASNHIVGSATISQSGSPVLASILALKASFHIAETVARELGILLLVRLFIYVGSHF
ncbi:MAG: hypothetical protein ABWW69_01595 [Pyrodictiaceae archaeon]